MSASTIGTFRVFENIAEAEAEAVTHCATLGADGASDVASTSLFVAGAGSF